MSRIVKWGLFPSCLLCWWLIAVVSIAEAQAIDMEKCYSALITADEDGDRKIGRDEYFTFVSLMGLDSYGDSYADLPLVLQSTFVFLSCLCATSGSTGGQSCCSGSDPYLPNNGADVLETPTKEQKDYLFRVCHSTTSAVDQATPSAAPVEVPSTGEPTRTPTVKPTTTPTRVPTKDPTATPTNIPTKKPEPTTSPTLVPTQRPTTGSPTMSPSKQPTSRPTITMRPTINGIDAVVRTVFSISIVNGKRDDIQSFTYTPDLINAMDIVASDVGVLMETETVTTSSTGNLTNRRRKLAVTVKLPTSIVLIQDGEWSESSTSQAGTTSCPIKYGNPETDRCEEVTASVELFLVDEDEEFASAQFKSLLDLEILDGRLQEALETVNPQSDVKILTGIDSGSKDKETPIDSTPLLSTGAITGLVAVGLAGVVFVYMLLSRKKKKDTNGRHESGAFQDTQTEEPKLSVGSGLDWQQAATTDEEAPSTGAVRRQGSPRKGPAHISDVASDGGVSKEDSTGWSDVYSSSMGSTRSMDDGLQMNMSLGDMGGSGDGGVANLEELEAAIMSGDWAAVGASAALLAASQYESGSLSNSKTSMSIYSKESSDPSLNKKELNTEKAMELDQLINTGDWEGVIQAAARYEAEFNQEGGSASVFEDSDSRSDSRSGSITSGSYFSSSLNPTTLTSGTNPSGSSSNPPNMEELRREVETLVSKVVPEELDHVDEMIAQFKGRENELLETLRSMQERDVAQKAKIAEQQKAKLGIKMAIQQKKSEARMAKQESSPGAAAATHQPSTQTSNDAAAAAAAADWAIARAMANLERQDEVDESDDEEMKESLPDDEPDEEGSL